MNKNPNQTLLLLKQLEDLKHKLRQFQTLLGICPFDKEELKGDKGDTGRDGYDGTFESLTKTCYIEIM